MNIVRYQGITNPSTKYLQDAQKTPFHLFGH